MPFCLTKEYLWQLDAELRKNNRGRKTVLIELLQLQYFHFGHGQGQQLLVEVFATEFKPIKGKLYRDPSGSSLKHGQMGLPSSA
jgi:hypothetical protein